MKTCEKQSFSKKIIRRNRILRIVLILMFVYMIAVGMLGFGDSRMMSDLAELVSRVIFFGGMIYVIVRIRKNKRLLENRILLKEKMVQGNDEMNRSLYEKSGGAVWDTMLIAQLFITLTASLVDMGAFYASLSTLAVVILVKAAACLYLRRGF